MNTDNTNLLQASGETVDAPNTQGTPAAIDVKSLFSGEALERKKAAQSWHNRSNTAHHEKRIGMAPRGTRRSMGKR